MKIVDRVVGGARQIVGAVGGAKVNGGDIFSHLAATRAATLAAEQTESSKLLRPIARKIAADIELSSEERRAVVAAVQRALFTEEDLRFAVAVVKEFESMLQGVVKTTRKFRAAKAVVGDNPSKRIKELEIELQKTRDGAISAQYAGVAMQSATRCCEEFARKHAALFEDVDVRELIERHTAEASAAGAG